MSRIAAELAHLLHLSEAGMGMYEFARDKAQRLASQEPAEFNELPLLLNNELRSRKFGPPRPSTNQPRRSE